MARTKHQKPEHPISDELPEQPVPIETDVANSIRYQIRAMPDTGWKAVVTEMQDYVTVHHRLINLSLERNQNRSSRFVAHKKTGRSAAQTKSGIVLRDDIPIPPPAPEERVNLEEFYRHGRIKRKNNQG